jgi:hypothetical protein
MEPHRPPALFLLFLVAQLACTTVYAPPDEPLTEEGLEEAIQTLQEMGDRVAILEDGLQAEVYVYEWRPLPPPPALEFDELLLHDPAFPEDRQVRMLVGPARSVYLPFASIRAVEARSWPMWSGVELEVAEAGEEELDGPVVIKAHDVEEAERLADAIDRVRRTRQPAARAPSATAPAD